MKCGSTSTRRRTCSGRPMGHGWCSGEKASTSSMTTGQHSHASPGGGRPRTGRLTARGSPSSDSGRSTPWRRTVATSVASGYGLERRNRSLDRGIRSCRLPQLRCSPRMTPSRNQAAGRVPRSRGRRDAVRPAGGTLDALHRSLERPFRHRRGNRQPRLSVSKREQGGGSREISENGSERSSAGQRGCERGDSNSHALSGTGS